MNSSTTERRGPDRVAIPHFLLRVLLLLAVVSLARAQSPAGDPANYELIALRDSGDKECLNLLFLAEGYTSAEKDQFLAMARKVDDDFCQPKVLGSHKALINVFALFVPSLDSGIDEPENGVVKDTFYDVGWASTSWFFKANRRDFLTKVAPWADFQVYILNTARIGGGSAGKWLYLTPYSDGQKPLISGLFTHEFGHSLAGFSDEYIFAGATKSTETAPNRAIDPALRNLPWRHWVANFATLPSPFGLFDHPPAQSQWSIAGAYPGCITIDSYRPYWQSFMKQIDGTWADTFFDVYREQYLLNLYKYADPIASVAPAVGTVTATADGSLALEVTVRAVPSNLIFWYVDGLPIAQGQTRVVLDTAALAAGDHRVTVWVVDATEAVRMDYRKGLESTREWTFKTTAASTRPKEQLVQNAGAGYPRKSLRNGQLVALSTRGFVQDESQRMIGGFVIDGSRSKRLLIRGVGPALQRYGISQALPDPRLLLFRGGETTPYYAADDWGTEMNAAQIAADAVTAGDFPLDAGSKDAAVSVTLAPGIYTVHLVGKGTQFGVSLLEIYDLTPTESRLVSLSTRGSIAPGERSLICGFALNGPETKQCLVRGVGPGLRQYGVTNAIGGVRLELNNMSGPGFPIMNNFGWNNHPTPWITDFLGRQVGLSGLAPNSNDSVILADLQPGTYTAVATPDQGTGEALVEIYEVE